MTEEITTYHLVMDSPDALRTRLVDDPLLRVERLDPPNAQLNHAMFMEIGQPYRWFSRLTWTRNDWEQWVSDPRVRTLIGFIGATPFGYAELRQHADRDSATTEIDFFGIFSAFFGRGLGGHLLTNVVQAAWAVPGTERVYLHTCTADHASALANYKARGFTLERTETEVETIPDPDDPAWNSAAYYRSLRG